MAFIDDIRTPLPGVRRVARALACLALVAVPSACEDAEGDPVAVLVAEETHAALLIQEELPSLPGLTARTGLERELSGVVDLWLSSWSGDSATAVAGAVEIRERAYQQAAAPLAAALSTSEVRELHERLEGALDATRRLPATRLDPEMAERVADVRRLHERAGGLLTAAGDDGRREALVLTLKAADGLRTVGPGGVARMLTRRAEGALGAARADDPVGPRVDSTTLDRADRLVRGARRAVEEGEWTRAIRRAYYACQLLGISTR